MIKKTTMKTKERTLKTHQPCPDCGSSDALSIYFSGSTHCFSCGKTCQAPSGKNKVLDKEDELVYHYSVDDWLRQPKVDPKVNNYGYSNSDYNYNNKNYKKTIGELKDDHEDDSMLNTEYTYEYLPLRNLTKETLRFYNILTKINSNDEPISVGFVYPNGATKIRALREKQFTSLGPMTEASCFGVDKFTRGMSKSITITEGEMDAASVFQMLGSKYPAISVRSASSARRDLERDYEYINSFEQIYLCFDNDEPGQRALADAAKLFDPNKTYHVKLDRYKDANEYLVGGAEREFVSVWYNARKFLPKGIVSDYRDITELLSKEDKTSVATYPFPTIDSMAYGIRTGEITLFTAPEKIGKTEVMRAIEYHLLKTTDENIGIIHLEEKEKRSVQGLVGYELGIPAHLPTSGASIEDQILAYKRLTKRDGRLHFYSHFGSDDPDSILGVIRYLVAVCKCRFIFLDHITMIVTGFEGDDERKKLDYISTRLAMMTRELDFHLFLVSHVNDDGRTRGSRNISKIADLLLHLTRDTEAESVEERNTTKITCRGNRFGSVSGPAGLLYFDPNTFRLSEKEDGYKEESPSMAAGGAFLYVEPTRDLVWVGKETSSPTVE